MLCVRFSVRAISRFDIHRFFSPSSMTTAVMYSEDMKSHHHTRFHPMKDVHVCVYGYLSLPIFGIHSIDAVEASIFRCVERFFMYSMNNTWSNNHCSHEMMAVSPVHRPAVSRVFWGAIRVYVRLCVRVLVCGCSCVVKFRTLSIACSAGEMWWLCKTVERAHVLVNFEVDTICCACTYAHMQTNSCSCRVCVAS